MYFSEMQETVNEAAAVYFNIHDIRLEGLRKITTTISMIGSKVTIPL